MKIHYKRPPLTSYQTQIIDSPHNETVTYACTKSGKTVGHCVWFAEGALLKDREGEESTWMGPSIDQSRIAFNNIRFTLL